MACGRVVRLGAEGGDGDDVDAVRAPVAVADGGDDDQGCALVQSLIVQLGGKAKQRLCSRFNGFGSTEFDLGGETSTVGAFDDGVDLLASGVAQVVNATA